MFEWKSKKDGWIADYILKDFERLEKRRQIFQDLWELIVKLFRPRRYDILGNSEKGQRFGAKIYDQNPANSLAKFVAGKIGYMISRTIPWIQFTAPNSRMMRLDHIKSYCQEAAEQVLYAAGRSTFYEASSPHCLDADSVGISVMVPMLDEVEDRVVFDVVHPRDIYISRDQFGKPITFHRPMSLTGITALEKFGKDVLPSNWFNKDGWLKEPFEEHDFLWAVYPNNDRDNDSLLSEDKTYIVFCTLKGEKPAKKSKLVYKKGRDFFPIVYSPGRDSGCDYGTSIAAECLTSAQVTNKLSEKSIVAVHRYVEPAAIVSKSLRGHLHTDPGGRTYVSDIQREGAKTWMESGNWPLTDAQIQRLDQQIEDRMFIRFFEMLSAGDLRAKTAYEVSQMMGEKAVGMSTIVDTYEKESLEPMVNLMMQIETIAGRMPEPPEELLLSGGRVDIRYLGPLAVLQRSLIRGKGIVDAVAAMQQMMILNAEINQELTWKFNWSEMAEEVAVNTGMPQKFVRSDEEVKNLSDAMMRQQQIASQMEMLEKAGKAAPGLSKAPEPGSPAASLIEAAA